MSLIDLRVVMEAAKVDPEFTRETRYLNGAVKVGIAGEEYVLRFVDGKLVSIGTEKIPDADCKIFVKGTQEHWTNLLAKFPKPFYQCIQSTAVKHQLKISDTNETYAYLPALNRLTQLMRSEYNRGR